MIETTEANKLKFELIVKHDIEKIAKEADQNNAGQPGAVN
jgi:hypothetical protein